MMENRNSKKTALRARRPSLLSLLVGASLSLAACADVPPGGDDEQVDEAGQDDQEALEQVFGPVGGTGDSAKPKTPPPRRPRWPGGFGPVGGDPKKPERPPPRWPAGQPRTPRPGGGVTGTGGGVGEAALEAAE